MGESDDAIDHYEGILSQLMEKKDLRIYLITRMKIIEEFDITQFPEERRAYLAERKKGRLLELQALKTLLYQDRIKAKDIEYWRTLKELGIDIN